MKANENNNNANIAAVAILLILTFSLSAVAANYDTAIKDLRTGTFNLTVKDDDGKALKGAAVNYEMAERAFHFGFFTDVYNQAVSEKMADAGFDYVTVHLNWNLTEPQPGVYDWNNTEVFYDAQAYHEAGFKVKATALIWFQAGFFPEYLRGQSFKQVKNHAIDHARAVVGRYGKYIDVWNVVNEPLASWANELNFSASQMITIIKEVSAVVRELDPSAQIMVNHADPMSFYSAHPFNFVELMEKENVDYDIIGLQVYYTPFNMNFNGRPLAIKDIDKMVDRYAAFGKEIQISEVSNPSRYDGGWNEKSQSDWSEELYSLFYSRPEITAVTWWNATDRMPFIENGGLTDFDGKEKKVLRTLAKLMDEWNGSGSGKTSPAGAVKLRGHAGTYDVTINDPKSGLETTISVKLEGGRNRKMTYTFKENKIKKAIKRENKKLIAEVNNRRSLLEGLATYWDAAGDSKKAKNARKALDANTVSPSARVVLPSDYSNILDKLERALDAAAVTKTTVLRGSDMKVKKGLWVFTDWNMDFYSFGRVGRQMDFNSRSAKVTVRAAGSWAHGWPIFSVAIGSTVEGDEAQLTEGGFKNYSFDMTYRPGKNLVDLAFVNDRSFADGYGRDMFVESITIEELSWEAPSN